MYVSEDVVLLTKLPTNPSYKFSINKLGTTPVCRHLTQFQRLDRTESITSAPEVVILDSRQHRLTLLPPPPPPLPALPPSLPSSVRARLVIGSSGSDPRVPHMCSVFTQTTFATPGVNRA